MKILLADDDTNIHLVITMWLNRNGHEVASVYNGEDALEALTREKFDVLITDINMPLLKGYDLVHQVLDRPECPRLIVVLTSRCDVADLRRRLDNPRVHFLNKPFSPAGLAALIDEWDEPSPEGHEQIQERHFYPAS